MATDNKINKTSIPRNAVVKTIRELYEERALMSFRDTFVKLRKEHGWTQTQVAEKLAISVGQIKKYEKGSSAPSLSMLSKIATLFGVSADLFVFEDGKGVAGKKLDTDLLKRFEMIGQLPQREQDAILILIDSVIAKHRLREVMGS